MSKHKKKRKPPNEKPQARKRFIIPYWLGFIIFGIVAAGLLTFYIWGLMSGVLEPAP